MRALMVMWLVLSCGFAVAAPSVDDIQRALEAHDPHGALAMVEQVVREKPDSAKAHYVYSQVLEKNDQAHAALHELAIARRLDPGISFTTQDKIRAYEEYLSTRISNDSARISVSSGEQHSGTGGFFGWAIALAVGAGVFVFRRRSSPRQSVALAARADPLSSSTTTSSRGSESAKIGLAAAGGFAAGVATTAALGGQSSPPSWPFESSFAQNDGSPPGKPVGDGSLGGLGNIEPGFFDDSPASPSAPVTQFEPGISNWIVDFGSKKDWDSPAFNFDAPGGVGSCKPESEPSSPSSSDGSIDSGSDNEW